VATSSSVRQTTSRIGNCADVRLPGPFASGGRPKADSSSAITVTVPVSKDNVVFGCARWTRPPSRLVVFRNGTAAAAFRPAMDETLGAHYRRSSTALRWDTTTTALYCPLHKLFMAFYISSLSSFTDICPCSAQQCWLTRSSPFYELAFLFLTRKSCPPSDFHDTRMLHDLPETYHARMAPLRSPSPTSTAHPPPGALEPRCLFHPRAGAVGGSATAGGLASRSHSLRAFLHGALWQPYL